MLVWNFQYWKIKGIKVNYINVIIKNFQVVEIFIEIQVVEGNRKRHYISVWKIKIMVTRDVMKRNGRAVNLFIFHFTTMLILPDIQLSPSLSKINKITRRMKNEIGSTSILSRKTIFRERECSFANSLKKT